MSDPIVEKVDELIKGAQIDTAEAIAFAKKENEEVLAKAQAQVEAIKEECFAKVTALESKIATLPSAMPAVIRRGGGIRGDVHRRVAEEMRTYVKAGQQVEKEFKLFTDEAEYRAFMVETDGRMTMMEASGLTGSGLDVGGRTAYDPVFFSWRLMNPLRRIARNVATDGSSYQFRVKTGNIGATWGYPVQANGAATTLGTNIFQVSLKDLNAYATVRTAALDDIDGLELNIVDDLYQEWSQAEALSMIQNYDQSGTTTTATGGVDGVRGLDTYPGYAATYTGGATTAPAYGTSGTAASSGIHSLATYDQLTTNAAGQANNIKFGDLLNFITSLPQQYWDTQGGFSGSLAWMMSPGALAGIRGLVDNNGTPVFERMSPALYNGYIGSLLGIPVIINGYMDSPLSIGSTAGTVNKTPIYFGNWDRFYTIVDRMAMTVRRFDQTVPGSLIFFGEKRLATAVKDPFAGVRYRSTATAQA